MKASTKKLIRKISLGVLFLFLALEELQVARADLGGGERLHASPMAI
jgi:hypothetical protein